MKGFSQRRLPVPQRMRSFSSRLQFLATATTGLQTYSTSSSTASSSSSSTSLSSPSISVYEAIDSPFAAIAVINLKGREDRWQHICDELCKAGLIRRKRSADECFHQRDTKRKKNIDRTLCDEDAKEAHMNKEVVGEEVEEQEEYYSSSDGTLFTRIEAVDGREFTWEEMQQLGTVNNDGGVMPSSSSSTSCTSNRRGNFISRLGMRRLALSMSEEANGGSPSSSSTQTKDGTIWGMDLTPGGVGCALSHAYIWRWISLAGFDGNVLVVEDDSLFPVDFLDRYKALMSAATLQKSPHNGTDDAAGGAAHSRASSAGGAAHSRPSSAGGALNGFVGTSRQQASSNINQQLSTASIDWTMVFLSGLDTQRRGHLLEVEELHAAAVRGSTTTPTTGKKATLRRVPAFHRTTNCYVVSPVGAQRLLQSTFPMTFQLDTQLNMRQAADDCTGEPYVADPPGMYTVYPPIVVQATRFGTDIQDGLMGSPVEEEQSRLRDAQWK